MIQKVNWRKATVETIKRLLQKTVSNVKQPRLNIFYSNCSLNVLYHEINNDD